MRPYRTLAGMLLVACVVAGNAHSEQSVHTKANAAFHAGDYATAAAGYEAILAESPRWSQGWVRLGQCRYLLGDGVEAEASIRRAVEIDAAIDRYDAYLVPGALLYRAKRYDEAVTPLSRALAGIAAAGDENARRRAEARELLAYAQYLDRRYDDARRTLEAHVSAGGFAADPVWYLALSCQRTGDYECALVHLESVVEHGGDRLPLAVEYLARWSRYYAEHGAGDRELLRAAAVRHAGTWYRADPSSAAAVENYGATMLAAERAAQLAETLAGRSADDNCQVPLQLARAQNSLDRREAAEASALLALGCDPMSADAAIEVAYSQVARLRPEHTRLVAVLEDRALAQSALASIAQARRLDPSRPAREENLERQLHETLGRLDEAATAFERETADYDRQVEDNERDVIRQRCLNLHWLRRDESRALSAEEQQFFDEHDCDRYTS